MPAKKKDSRPKKFSQRWSEAEILAMRQAAKRAGMSATGWVKEIVRREIERQRVYGTATPCEISLKSPVLGLGKKDPQTA